MVSRSVSLPCSGFFSPFPHGTGSLSVSREYLALPDGPGCFTLGSSCPALLRIPPRRLWLRARGCHPLRPDFPVRRARLPRRFWRSYYPGRAWTRPVWAPPLSLAATRGMTSCSLLLPLLRCFSSRRSPRRLAPVPGLSPAGSPIRTPADHRALAPPRGFSQLAASFIASGSLGIHHPPFSVFPADGRRSPDGPLRSSLLVSSKLVKDLHQWRIRGSNP